MVTSTSYQYRGLIWDYNQLTDLLNVGVWSQSAIEIIINTQRETGFDNQIILLTNEDTAMRQGLSYLIQCISTTDDRT